MTTLEVAKLISTILNAAAVATPEPFGALIRIAAAGIAAGAVALDSGTSEADVVAHIHRVRHLPV